MAGFENFAISQEYTCVGVSFLTKLQSFSSTTLLKRDFNTGISCGYWKIFSNTYYEEHLRATGFDRRQKTI